MSEQQTLDQLRARDALEKVKSLRDSAAEEDYRRIARGLAPTIVNNGLGQACAMLLAKADSRDDANRRMYDHINEWLCSDTFDSPYEDGTDLLDQITANGQQSYVHAQTETLAWLEWTKKFAQAFLSEEDERE